MGNMHYCRNSGGENWEKIGIHEADWLNIEVWRDEELDKACKSPKEKTDDKKNRCIKHIKFLLSAFSILFVHKT